MIEQFQNGFFDVFLISTKAGGEGITLTRATRVIMFDAHWNPTLDEQANNRAHRIGQTKEVRVYRLFTANSIEEKIYEKQVHKTGMEKTILTKGSRNEAKHFTKHELCKVFSRVPDDKTCESLTRFGWKLVAQLEVDSVLKHPSCVIGISNHSTVYRQKRKSAFSEAQTSGITTKQLKLTMNESAMDISAERGPAMIVSEEGE